MNYCVLSGNIIMNIIVCKNDDVAAAFGAVPSYKGAAIGERYNPPPIIASEDKQPVTWSELDAAYQEGVNTAYDS